MTKAHKKFIAKRPVDLIHFYMLCILEADWVCISSAIIVVADNVSLTQPEVHKGHPNVFINLNLRGLDAHLRRAGAVSGYVRYCKEIVPIAKRIENDIVGFHI